MSNRVRADIGPPVCVRAWGVATECAMTCGCSNRHSKLRAQTLLTHIVSTTPEAQSRCQAPTRPAERSSSLARPPASVARSQIARAADRVGLIARDAVALEAVRKEVEAQGAEAALEAVDVADAAAVFAAAERLELKLARPTSGSTTRC